ncbi:MAG TPA: hypothetical protein VF192_01190 [Longimicrobiales bacterium]
MGRTYVREGEPHRNFVRLKENVQRGEDVRRVEVATVNRLEPRGVSVARMGRDGILTYDEFNAMLTAGRLLGALESTLTTRDAKGRAVLTVGVQRMIRYPGRRTEDQLVRARERIEALEKERAQREKEREQAGGGVSGLTASQRSEARRRAVRAMRLAYAHRGAVHYTQGSRRWDGIRLNLRSANDEFPRYADCSSLTTWALWNALTGASGNMRFPDIVNGAGWGYGYTGTQTRHGHVVSLGSLQLADLVFYGGPWPYGHVAMYAGNGMVLSHGSESGPHLLRVRYRGDVSHARRYI